MGALNFSQMGKGSAGSGSYHQFDGGKEYVSSHKAVESESTKGASDLLDDDIAISTLVSHVRGAWEEAKRAKFSVERSMMSSLRQRKGSYEPSVLAAIQQQGGSSMFLRLTDVKCRAAEAWIRDVLLPAGDRPWSLESTPVADLPIELKHEISLHVMSAMKDGGLTEEEAQGFSERLKNEIEVEFNSDAKDRADKMALLCEDQQIEGGFSKALSQVIDDVVTLKAGILKGPIIRKRKKLSWGGNFTPVADEKLVMEWERVSPFDLYPAPSSENTQDSPYLIERSRMSPRDLEALIGVEGFDSDAIKSVLWEQERGRLGSWLWTDMELKSILSDGEEGYWTESRHSIDVLIYSGSMQGRVLADWGLKLDDPEVSKEAEIWLVGDKIIKAVLNEHPLGLRPYHHTGAIKVNGEFWHTAIPELMNDIQGTCNATIRSLVNNMAIASGPMVEVNKNYLVDGQDTGEMHPWKQFFTQPSSTEGRGGQAIRFFQPNSNASELLSVFERMVRYADEFTGIPAYTYGSDSARGAGRTASGLSMLMNAAAKGIRSVIYNIDIDIIQPLIYQQYVWNMLYHHDDSVKGDCQVKARGATALIVKEQTQVRRHEFLAATNNPLDSEIIGVEGRAELLRESARTLDMPVDRIVPPREELKKKLEQQQQQQQQQAQEQMQQMQQMQDQQMQDQQMQQ